MTFSFEDCSILGKIILVSWSIAFCVFVLSTIVLGNNLKEVKSYSLKEHLVNFVFPFIFKKSEIQERAINWYLPYLASALVVVPLTFILIGGAYFGYFCVAH